jgi:hypothetical protein
MVYLWTLMARGSPKILNSLLDNGIGKVIEIFFNHESQKNSKIQQTLPINEIILLTKELNPKTDVFTSNMSLESRKTLFQSLVEPELPEELLKSSKKSNSRTNEDIIKKNKKNYVEFVKIILPLVIKTFTSNMNQNIKLNCLTIIGTIIYYSTKDMLKDILFVNQIFFNFFQDIPISSLITRLLGSNDFIFISTSIQISEILIEKLPDVFSIYFVREGVSNEIKKISGLENNKNDVYLIDEMRKKTKIAFDQAIEKFQVSKIEVEEISKEDEEMKQPVDVLNEITKGMKNLNKEKNQTKQFVPPIVDPPEIPKSSRIAESRDSFKNPELMEYVVSSAQLFQKKYVNNFENQSNICKDMRDFGEELLDLLEQPNEEDEIELLNKIASILISEEGISTFEFLDSGIISILHKYLKDKTKLKIFFSVFDKEAHLESQSVQSPIPFEKFSNGAFDSPTIGSPITSTNFGSPMVHKGSPGSYSASPFRSSSLKSSPFKSKGDNTYLVELIKKIQNCLTQSENLPLIVKDGNSLLLGLASVLNIVAKDFKIQLQSLDDESIMFQNVEMSPLEKIKNLCQMIPELERKHEKSKDISLNLKDDPNFGGFTIEEKEDDDRVAITEVKLEESKDYDYLEKKVERVEKEESPYTIYLNGKPLNPDLNMFNCVYQYGNNGDTFSPRHPSNCNLWKNTFILTYKKKNTNFLDEELKLNQDTFDCLELLKLIHSKGSKFPKQIFKNEKISAKLTRQMNDPLMLFTNTLPKWCQVLTVKYPFIFSYSIRKSLFDATSLGIARSLKIMEEKIDKGKIINIEKKKLKVERENIFQYAHQIFKDFGLSRCILEYQYQDEVGVGLGPTVTQKNSLTPFTD